VTRARLEVLLAAVLFGTTGTALALGPGSASPLGVGAARIVIGGAILAVLAAATGALRGPWPIGLVLSAGVGVAVYQLSFFEAVDRTGVAIGAIVAIGSGPVFVGVFERLVDGVWPGRRWVVATAIATAGVALLTVSGARGASADVVGIGLALVAGAGYATYTVIAKRLIRGGHAPVGVMGVAFGIAAVLLIPVLIGAGTGWLGSGSGIAVALYLGIFPTAVSYVLFARGLTHLPASEVATLVLAEPLTATALGVLALDEAFGALDAAGAVLVLAALVILGASGLRFALGRRAPRAPSR
jgi:drug/metabolite transporter, DME family